MRTFGFIIATCLREKNHLLSLNKCIESIKYYNKDNKIVIIVDFTSNIEYVNQIYIDNNITIEKDTPHIPADMLIYYYFLKNKYFDIVIPLQDSMNINCTFNATDINEINNIKYLWHFTNHRIHWSIIKEPVNEFTIKNNIKIHDDLILYFINNSNLHKDLLEYCIKIYNNKDKWSGCFGALAIMTHDFLNELNLKTDIINLMFKMNNNRNRRAIESIFSLFCQYTLGHEIHDSFDGLYYDGYNGGHGLISKYISKISFDRK